MKKYIKSFFVNETEDVTIRIWRYKNLPLKYREIMDKYFTEPVRYEWIAYIPSAIKKEEDPIYLFCSHFGKDEILTIPIEKGVLRVSYYLDMDFILEDLSVDSEI